LQRAVVRTIDGRSDFDGLHSRKHDHQVEFNAFDSRSATVRISTSSRCRCPKPVSPGFRRGPSTASSFPISSKARSSDLFSLCLPDGIGEPGLQTPRDIARQHPACSRMLDQFAKQGNVVHKKAADISATLRYPERRALAITSRDSIEGRTRMRDEQPAGTEIHNKREHNNSMRIRRSMRERSRSWSTPGRSRRNKQGHSRHNSRTPDRRSTRNRGHRRRRSTLCHRSLRQQSVRRRDLHPTHPSHPAMLELVMVLPRQ
jgi:hypothetical protein